MLIFIFVFLFILGVGLIVSGSQTLTQQVKTSLPPEDLEFINSELLTRKHTGQIILVSLAIVFMFYLT